MTQTSKIIYTITDEAPALATHSLLPIVSAFAEPSGISVETRDISLAGRIIANFPDYVSEDQKISDHLAELGELAKKPEANIIKLPNISASIPQLKAAIKELQGQGYALPNYPDEPENDEEKEIKANYDKIKGSAVNPVLREGNSDRRAPKAIKNYARKNPHSMGAWSSSSESHVATMSSGDFAHNEKSVTLSSATSVKIVHTDDNGNTTILKDNLSLLAGEIIDATVLSKKALLNFLETQVLDAKEKNVLFSLHMKATMMKVSDPIIFGHAVRVFFKDVFVKYADIFEEIGVDVNNGFGNLLSSLNKLPEATRKEIQNEIDTALQNGPDLAMVNSDKGITNLHVPSDVIIDASMPAMIRNSGQMWNVNSNGASDAALSTSKISSLENIPFGLVGSNTVNQNGAKSFTVAIPGSVNIEDFDKVFFYCLNFDQFWDFGSYNSFSQSSCSVLNIEDVSKTNGIRVYPNPSSNVIHLSNIGKSSGEIRIFDVLGKSIYRRNKDLDRDIDVSNFKAGIYILKIDIENKSVTQKLVIR